MAIIATTDEQHPPPAGITAEAWAAIGAKRNGSTWWIPERDGKGNTIGHAIRPDKGRKCFEKGGKRGLTMRWPLRADAGLKPDDPLIIVEGATDTAAAIDLGFEAVGRPSAMGGNAHLRDVVQERHVCIIMENDKSGTGRRGAEKCAAAIFDAAASVKIIEPPDCVKDLREWRDAPAGVDREELLHYINRAEPLTEPPKIETTHRGESVQVVESPAPLPLAETYIEANCKDDHDRLTLRRWRGDYWRFTGSAYEMLADEELDAELYRHLESLWTLDQQGRAKRLKPRGSMVREVRLAMPSRGLLLSDKNDAPTWIGGECGIDAAEFVPCANGLLRVPNRKLHPATPDFFGTYSVGYDYDPAAPQPAAWLAFLRDLFGDDAEAVMLLKEWCGYVLTCDVCHHKMLLIVGPKRSGKGTIGRVLRGLLGESNVCGPTLSSLTERFGLQPLLHKPLAIISDARLSGRADQAIVAERLLAVSGEDAITVDIKHKDAVTCTLPTRFLLLTNELPRIADSSGALASRFLILTLRKSWYGEEDTGLTARLLAELPGVLNWALDGWDRLHERGRFTEPTSSAEAVAELDELGSPIGAFVRDCCEVQQGASVVCADLFAAWKLWCQDNGRDYPGTLQAFSRDLHAAVPGIKTTRPRGFNSARFRQFEGIELRYES